MKKIVSLVLTLTIILCSTLEAQRYLSKTFTAITVDRDIQYGRNFSLFPPTPSGKLISQDLMLNLYHPTGDIVEERPLVILFHTGNFLPQGINGSVFGTVDDEPIVEIATRLAELGYVVAVPEYRLGWNPISTSQEIQINSLVNATYRGIQDARSCVRFFRKDALDGNNQFGICPERITYWGVGTGGYISTAAAALDSYEELAILPKFIGSDFIPMVVPAIHGDPFGTSYGFNPNEPVGCDTMSLPNHVGYEDGVQLSVSMGGAIWDTSWIDTEDPAFICFHVPDDPFIPYMEGVYLSPSPINLYPAVHGSYLISEKANSLGLNESFTLAAINDEFTEAANKNNDSYEGLFPFIRPTWSNPFDTLGPRFSEAAPWDWWDFDFWKTQAHPSCAGVPPPDCSFDFIARLNNRDASEAKGKTYLDSIMGYFAPRAYAQLNLWSPNCVPLITELILTSADVSLNVSPNPAATDMLFRTKEESPMQVLELFDLSGQRVKTVVVNSNNYNLTRDYLQTGMYIAKLRFEKGILTRKIIFN